MVFNSAADFGRVDYRQLVRCLKILDIELHAQFYRYIIFCCLSLYAAKGDKGDPCPVEPILQPFINSNILGIQTIPHGGAVVFPPIASTPQDYYAEGIEYDGVDTFKIIYPGLYSLTCVLSLDTDSPDNTFYIEINKVSPVAGTANMGKTGQIVLTRVGYFTAGTTLRIVNGSGHPVTLSNASMSKSSTGHLALFRFADDGVG